MCEHVSSAFLKITKAVSSVVIVILASSSLFLFVVFLLVLKDYDDVFLL